MASGKGTRRSRGNSLGSFELPAGVAGEALIPSLEKNGFKQVEGRTFEAMVPAPLSESSHVGLVALRDTTTGLPNEFILGVGPGDSIVYYESHDGPMASHEAWKDQIRKRIRLVEQLASRGATPAKEGKPPN